MESCQHHIYGIKISGRDELELGLARLEEPVSAEEGEEEESGPESGESTSLEETIRARQMLSASLRVVQSGFLWRLSSSRGGSERKWIRRWFALRGDACLYFFKNEEASDTTSSSAH